MFLQVVSPSELVKSVGLAHTAAATSKEPIVINARVTIPLNTTAIGERNAYVYESMILEAPKAAAQAWAWGAALYWDAAAKNFTTTASGNTLCGFALEPKLAADTVSGLIAFDSFAAL